MRHSVLVIEDDVDIRECLQEVLELDGFQVVLAGNGREGLDVLSHTQPCVIVLDLMMPVMNGWEFLEARRDQSIATEVPVIVVSAACTRATTAPADLHMGKPVDVGRLLAAVHRYCRASTTHHVADGA